MLKLSKNEIDFCGKKRRFKRCPNKVLRDANKDVEDIKKDLQEKMENGLKMGEESRELRLKANKITTKEEPTAAEKKKADGYIKKAEKIEADLEEFAKSIEDQQDEYDDKIIKAYGKVCMTLLEPMEEGEFEANYDSTDMVIAKNLSLFYDMYMTGFSEAKIQMRVRQLIDAEHEGRFQFREEA